MRHLLTHSSGIGSRSSPIYRAEQVRLRSITLPQMVDNAARVPLFEDPGTRFRYGISTTVLGRLVEIWSGQALEDFLQQRVFGPLDMTDTVFWADPE
ncbi:MAG: serine hydrolase domain-containing protein, partial [Vicinamibacterales bacterium]|nr:serine hydrolase domain-containing protein [Vicinamibacterales bacterium]